MQTVNLPKIKRQLSRYTKQFNSASPYPHIVIDDFFLTVVAEKLLKQFPTIDQMHLSSAFSGVAEKKNQLSDVKKMPKIFADVFKDLASAEFRKTVSQISGIDPILADPDLVGGGLHQGTSGSFLDVHADFNKHPKSGKYRRLNILIYLNKDWKKSYGGNLEMWDKNMKVCVRSLEPVFNRCLIFATDKYSHHGYSKMTLPKNVTRKSIAAYYYSNIPAVGEDKEFHNTLFRARPGELRNKFLYPVITSKLFIKLRQLQKRFFSPE